MCSSHYLLRKIVFAITGPELISVPTGFRTPSEPYAADVFERVLSFAIKMSDVCIDLAKWTVWLWLPFAISDLFHWNVLYLHLKLGCTLTATYFVLYILRGFVRLMNPYYKRFVIIYLNAEDNLDQNLIDALTLYGFRYPWPAQFDVRDLEPSLRFERKLVETRHKESYSILMPFLSILANTIGVRMVYPGCLSMFNSWALEPRMKALESLRTKYNARRVGLITNEGLFVEAFYADRRREESENGEILVICCEGNAGFAEIGISGVPLSAGFSILAWNHPGFGSSMGMPFPEQEMNAAEAVVLFAIHHLHFEPADIRLFGWSIGGFSATWAAMQLPSVGGLILDATFDALDELSRNALPFIGESVPVAMVQSFFNLNNVAQITEYPGPIRIIRRSNDEVISTDADEQRLSNRGNYLVFGLLKYRFPHLFNDDTEVLFWKYLAMDKAEQESYLTKHGIVDEVMAPILQHEFRKEMLDFACSEDDASGLTMDVHRSLPFPSHLGEEGISDAMKRSVLIYLTSKYFMEAKGSHCTTLDQGSFQEPWSESLVLCRSQTVNIDLETEGSSASNGYDDSADGGEINDWEKVA
ncbi:Abhydrolase domain-containing protein 16A [Echinococcus granulosus]|uniref:Abhydrolase domain containing protein 16A n=1 Tax=Echinococcus granulosus TaxID=6210 RepID=A0A068WNF4_ECHGR|nr:Abhydrolase domain-containing protein 16A [Echinococcus granulosus]CDS19166.1 abhydrolase domain containing protein 16A [Echinococcus granulosus]